MKNPKSNFFLKKGFLPPQVIKSATGFKPLLTFHVVFECLFLTVSWILMLRYLPYPIITLHI